LKYFRNNADERQTQIILIVGGWAPNMSWLWLPYRPSLVSCW